MRNIVLCVDGSLYALSAAYYAADMAKLMDAHVDILYASDLRSFEASAIADFGGSIGVQPFQEMLSTVASFEQEKAQFLREKFSSLFEDAGLAGRYRFHHRTGLILDTFDEFKKTLIGVDMIILGKCGESSEEDGRRVGETLDRILNSGTYPCLVAPQEHREIKNILIAYDGSDSATKAIHFLERNPYFSHCKIHLLAVSPDVALKNNMKSAEEILRGYAGLNVVVSQSTSDDIAHAIIEYVKNNNIGMLMIGSFSHNIIRRFFMGSTTMDIVENATCAMMVFS